MPFDLDEYDRAFGAFSSDAIQALAIAGSALLREMGPGEKSPGALGSMIQTHDGEVVDLPSVSVKASYSVSHDAVIACDTAEFANQIDATAEEFAEGLERHLISTIQAVTNATGNVTDASGRNNVDAFIEGLERIELSLDDSGELNLPTLVMHPDDVDTFGLPTPEQRDRIDAVLRRKKAELVARRRSRRIPRRR